MVIFLSQLIQESCGMSGKSVVKKFVITVPELLKSGNCRSPNIFQGPRILKCEI
jgi:hypothetical protein